MIIYKISKIFIFNNGIYTILVTLKLTGAVDIKKIITLMILGLLCFSSISTAISFTNLQIKPFIKINPNQNYTHTVFSGVASAQTCGPCNNWSKNIYNVYASGNYDFKYVTMIIFDENGQVLNYEALNWSNNYNIINYPVSIFDGDYKRIEGDNIEQLPGVLNTCGNRSVSNITANIICTWLENATINVNITIQNNEGIQYNGHIEAFISEFISRYKTSEGIPFHFGFLDFAFHKNISINTSEIYSDYIVWNGSEHYDEHGNNFSDIKENNIEVILAVYNISNGYVDETVFFSFPNNPPNSPTDPYPANGQTGIDLNVDLTWNCSDPDEDNLTYDVYFGTINPPPLVKSNISKTLYDPGALSIETTYYWKIIAWDPRGASNESLIWNFKTRVNNPPNQPIEPIGPSKGQEGQELDYKTLTIDPDGDDLYYWFEWGDGENSGWLGPYPSIEIVNKSHVWMESGEYEIKVKAKDIFGAESNWSDSLTITIIEPLIQIINISGGLFRIKAVIKNTGELVATNITWNINLISGYIFRGTKTSGKIDKIYPGDEITIKSKVILGLGRTDITVNAKLQDGGLDIKNADAFVFVFLIRIKDTFL